jgi:N-acetylglucosaminyldiphosphoundecaprenol N-acetyl-beta-D-mannosaminyltransferase
MSSLYSTILGFRVFAGDHEKAFNRIIEQAEKRNFQHVMFVTGTRLLRGRWSKKIRPLLTGGHLLLPKGSGVRRAAKLLHQPIETRFAEVDVFMNLLRHALEHKQTLFFLGSCHETISAAVDNLRKNFPGIAILGSHNGYFSEKRGEEIAEAVKKFAPHYLFVGMGFPRQDAWIEKYKKFFPTTVCISVGDTFELCAGTRRRAPQWMRDKGIEGMHKARQQPLRVFRLFCVFLFICASIVQRLRKKGKPHT